MLNPTMERDRARGPRASTDTQGLVRVAAAPRDPRSGAARSVRDLPLFVAYVVLQLAQLAALHRLDPRFFWLDDAQAQFGPMTWWMGRNQERGLPPLMDPDQGMAGNLVADMQYGALDPLHWGLQALAAQTDDLLVMAWGFAALCTSLLGVGALSVLRQHRVHGALALAGAVGIASSGFLLWYGSTWWPMLWSAAWLPWLWWGLATRSRAGVPVVGVACWALLASGNPYILFFALALVLAQVAERRRDRGSWRAVISAPEVHRVVAGAGGLLLALPTILSTVELSPVMSRLEPDPLIGNAAFGVANLADVVVGGHTLLGQTNAWGGSIGLVPAMGTMMAALSCLALVDWKRALRAPGVLTGVVLWSSAVALTQLPTVVSVFRYPLRYLVVVQLALPLLVLIALAAAPRLTRGRLVLAGALALGQGALAVARAPVFLRWHVVATVLTAGALAAIVVLLLDGGRRRRWVASAVVPLVAWTGSFVGVGTMITLQHRVAAQEGTAPAADLPFRILPAGRELGTTIGAYRDAVERTDEVATVVTYDFGSDMGWAQGALRGNGGLLAGLRSGGGALAVWQESLNKRWCRTYQGATCTSPDRLLRPAGNTGTSWFELLSADRVLLDRDAPLELREYLDARWTLVEDEGAFAEYLREDELPGRVTAVDGVTVDEDRFVSGLARVGEPMDVYSVSTGAGGGSVVLRIPYWPGVRASLDGRPLDVGTVRGAVVRVDLPPDVSGARLSLSYEPIGERILLPALLGGAVLIAMATVLGILQRPRSSTAPRGSGRGAAQ